MSSIDALHTDFSELLTYLEERGEVSWRALADANFRKILLIAVASDFERSMQEAVFDFAKQIAGDDHPLAHLIQNKAIRRQYHTWFNWDARNANSFFGLFGEAFKEDMQQKVRDEEELDASIDAFLEIGRERNRLVHENFADFTMEKTSEDIYRLYNSAKMFVNRFPQFLRAFREDDIQTS